MPVSRLQKKPGFLMTPSVTTGGQQIRPPAAFKIAFTNIRSHEIVLFQYFKSLYR